MYRHKKTILSIEKHHLLKSSTGDLSPMSPVNTPLRLLYYAIYTTKNDNYFNNWVYYKKLITIYYNSIQREKKKVI